MADVFYTILVVWVLWKIFGRSSVKTQVFHHHYTETKKEGEIKISKVPDARKKSPDSEGEYTDYEEVK
jgi:hypothetical protein